MSDYHFTTFERGWIQALLLGCSRSTPTKKLGRHHPSIDCEVWHRRAANTVSLKASVPNIILQRFFKTVCIIL